MENAEVINSPVKNSYLRIMTALVLLAAIAGFSFALGLLWSSSTHAEDATPSKKESKTIYPKKTELDFEGLQIQGELRNPGEFYFQHRNEDQFDSLVKRRKNFHREMLRDALMGK